MNPALQSLLRYAVGPVIVLGVAVMGWTSEFLTRAGQTEMAKLAPTIVTVDSSKLDPGADGKLVFVSGPLSAGPLKDPDSGLETHGLRLRRETAILQWVESRKEVTRTDPVTKKSRHDHYEYNYSQQWREAPIDSSKFENKTKVNPPAPPLPASNNLTPGEVKVGVYSLPPEALGNLGVTASWHPPAEKPTASGRWDAAAGEFFPDLGPTGEPPVGTRRYQYSVTDLPAEVSALGQLNKDTLGPFGTRKPEVKVGKFTQKDFVSEDIAMAGLAGWIFRGLDALALFIGVFCLGLGRGWSAGRHLALVVGLWLLLPRSAGLVARF